MKIQYIAEDGTRFDDQDDCEQYETTQKVRSYTQLWANIKLYNSLGKLIQHDDPWNFLDEVYYIDARNVSVGDMFFLHNYAKFNVGSDMPNKPGFWRWDDNYEHWVSYQEEYTDFKNKWELMIKMIGE